MSGEIEAIADIATGTALARAVEPTSGERADDTSDPCKNCQAPLHGKHCHNCGQKSVVHRSLGAFGHDILHSVLHFDGKIWRTLPMLAWNPGHLTRRYVHGERAKFVSPLALFLFSVFLSFALFSLSGVGQTVNVDTKMDAQSALKALEDDKATIRRDIAALEAEKKTQVAKGGEPTDVADAMANIDEDIADHTEALQAIETEKVPEVRSEIIALRKFEIQKRENETKLRQLNDTLAKAKASGSPTGTIEEEIEGAKLSIVAMEKAGELVRTGKADMSDVKVNFFGNEKINAAFKHALENPRLLFYKVQSNAYKYSWILIPLSVPFVWLLFFTRRTFKLFDHAVFVTYSLCFMMVLSMVAGLLIFWEPTEIIGGLMLGILPPLHMYRQLKQAYGLSRFSALWRTFALSNFAIIALSLFVTMITLLGVTG